MNTIQAKWLMFRADSVPADTSDEQVESVRRVFYAGAVSMMYVQRDIMRIPNISEQARNSILDGLVDEMDVFQAQLNEEFSAVQSGDKQS